MPPSRHRSNLIAQGRPAESKPVDASDIDSHTVLGTRIEDIGPGKTILHSSYLLTPSDDEQLTLADALESKEAVSEFDPYNSGQFDRSRNWSKHPRK
jgi:hypothetical protein